MGGAATVNDDPAKWEKILKNVPKGKVYNFFSTSDWMLYCFMVSTISSPIGR